MIKYLLYVLGIIFAVLISGCADKNLSSVSSVSSVDGIALNKYVDDKNYFSINKPDNWKVEIKDYISVEDSSDNGVTNVRIQPIHLSGKYRNIDGRNVANYVIGKEKKNYQKFELNSVKESGDKKIIEITTSFNENGIYKKGVYTVFVNSPYALVSSYETRNESFSDKEKLMKAIILSYQQNNPKVGDTKVGDTKVGGGGSKIGELQKRILDNKATMSLPQNWNVELFPGCVGLVAYEGNDISKTQKGVVFMNGLHQSIEPLPPGVTPEDYVTKFMSKDFKTMTDVKIEKYEEGDLSALRATGANVKSMRISSKINGIPSTGSFTVSTYGTQYSSAVGILWGIFSTEEDFYSDALPLIKMFYSVDYSESVLSECRKSLNTAWEGANKLGEKIRSEGEITREENLKLYQDRQNRKDEFLDKFSDSILDRDKVYNPETDEVYEVDANFYQYYDLHREEYKYKDMRELEPGERLKYIPLDGNLRIQ